MRVLLWAALLVAGIAVFALTQLADQKQSSRQSEYGKVPSFSFTDQLGRTVTSGDLQGRPWIANFVFTRCPSVCPLLSAKFKALQSKLGDVDARFVSFSVDPEHDTPAVLREYADKYQADPERWRFVTGPIDQIEQTVVKGFKIHVGDPKPHEDDPSLVEIMHGEHFVLIDGEGTIRGYYRAEAAEMDELARDLRALGEASAARQREHAASN